MHGWGISARGFRCNPYFCYGELYRQPALFPAEQYKVIGDQCDKSVRIIYAVNVSSPNCAPSVPVPVFDGGSFGVTVLYYEDCVQCENPAKNCGNTGQGQPQLSSRPVFTYSTEVNVTKTGDNNLVLGYSIPAAMFYKETSCLGACQ